MAELPNLAGVATKNLVESIGSGRFQASYINWSRTLNLLRTHAPGWTANCITADDGSLLHKAPVGAYLLIQFVHTDGSETPAIPQAVMDNRNAAIPYEKITARDITDTQRRGTCMAAAFVFGLAYELWAKMPMESGYGDSAPDSASETAPKPGTTKTAPTKVAAEGAKESEVDPQTFFRNLAKDRGLSQAAVKGLEGLINGDYKKGIAGLKSKTDEEIKQLEEKFGSN